MVFILGLNMLRIILWLSCLLFCMLYIFKIDFGTLSLHLKKVLDTFAKPCLEKMVYLLSYLLEISSLINNPDSNIAPPPP